ncbi:hypothetical protein [Streptomyces sp. NPDC058279]
MTRSGQPYTARCEVQAGRRLRRTVERLPVSPTTGERGPPGYRALGEQA